jgi:hypothetical protein
MRTHALFAVALLSAGLSAWSAACSSDDERPPVGSPEAGAEASAADVTQPVDSGHEDAGIADAAVDAFDAAAEFADCAGSGDGGPDAGAQAPQTLKCTGLYDVWSTKQIASAVKEYAPAHPLWSDGAVKTRWVLLPAGQKIDTTDMDEWVFPVGTKFWKQFVVGGAKVETRYYAKIGATTWIRATYKWNATEDDAARLDTGEWAGATDGGDPGSYEIPSVGKCDTCHQGRTDKILGFDVVNLGLSGASGITLASLVNDGLLTAPPPATSLTIPEDTTGHAAPALGWLHTNCGITCHNSNPQSACYAKLMNLRLSYDELHPADGGAATVANLAAYQTTYDVGANLGAAPNKRIAPGDSAHSAISYLIGRRDPTNFNGQMPPIDSHQVDVAHVAEVNAWIDALP